MGTAVADEPDTNYDNSIRIEYQYIHTGDYQSSVGALDLGETDAHVLLLSGRYSLNDRWSVFGSVPFVQKRHKGSAPHDPNLDFDQFTPPDLRVVDDGTYHGGLQDFYGGVQYLALDGPLSISPYVSYGVPLTNYPIYGSAAIGKNIWQVPVGAFFQYIPYFSDWGFQADIAYVFSEKVLDVNLDYWLMYLSASYYVTPRFAPKIYISNRTTPHGLRYPEDFLDGYDNANFYYHDVTIRHDYLNAGIGFDYVASDRYVVSATLYKTLDAKDMAEVKYAFTIGLTRNF